MKDNRMEIKLKEIMDKQGMTLEKLKRNVQIDSVLLDEMYNEGLFDDTKVGVQTISELMIALNISRVNELVPKVNKKLKFRLVYQEFLEKLRLK